MLLWVGYFPVKKPFAALFKHISPKLSRLKKFSCRLSAPVLREKHPFIVPVPESREGPPAAKSLLKRVKTVPDLFYYYCTGH
jgi:hypothetical protein